MQPWEYTASFDPLGEVLSEGALSKLRQQSQVDFDRDFYDAILERSPDCLDVLRCQGELLARQGDFARAVTLDERVVRLCPKDPTARYNLACSLTRCGRLRRALTALKQAIRLGYNDWDHLRLDTDLEPLRGLPGYQTLLAEHGVRDET